MTKLIKECSIDECLIDKIQSTNDSKSFVEMLRRYKPLIYNRTSRVHELYGKYISEYEDILRIFELTFCRLMKKFNKDMHQRFSGYIYFYLRIRVDDLFRKERTKYKNELKIDRLNIDFLRNEKKEILNDKSIEESAYVHLSISDVFNDEKISVLFSDKEKFYINKLLKGASLNELAEELNMTSTNLSKQLYRTRKKLRIVLSI
jgi:RNA polymerase sigma factor (sigma-70 family)